MKIDVAHLEKVILSILESAGISNVEASVVADVMVMSDCRGIPTHGIYFLPMLIKRIESGVLEIPTSITEISSDGAVAHLDGGNGIGQIAASTAMDTAIMKASQSGIGLTLVKNTNHIGLLAYYSLMAAEKGMIGFCTCNSAAAMAPWGGAEPFFGTNPFSIAAPGGKFANIVLDMSTSIVARGKIRRALRMEEKIPPDWALDKNGKPTMDPEAAMEGSLLPIGGPKGYGMAFFIDLIAGLVSGSKFSTAVNTFHKLEGPTGVGVMALAIDISRFISLDIYYEIIEEHIRNIRNSSRAEGCDRIYLPGEIEKDKETLARKNGVEIDSGVVDIIDELLERRGMKLKLSEGVL